RHVRAGLARVLSTGVRAARRCPSAFLHRPAHENRGVTIMAVNLTPQYHEAEQEYKKAQTAEDRLAALQKMWKEVPKHKASEKLQSDLKQKISATREEIEHEKKTGKKSGVSN